MGRTVEEKEPESIDDIWRVGGKRKRLGIRKGSDTRINHIELYIELLCFITKDIGYIYMCDNRL